MIKIIDVNGKERNILSYKRILHASQNGITGEAIDEEYVEVMIKGKSGREWKEWYPLSDFVEKNPGLDV